MPLTRRALLQRLTAAALLSPVPVVSGRARADQVQFFRIGTGSTGGTYFPIGSLLASVISNPPGSRGCDRGGSCGVPGLIAVAQSTEGSVANVAAIAGGRLESGLCQADVAYWAFQGEAVFEGQEPITKLRTLANLYPEAIQLVVRADAGIRSVADLKGKRISVDREGSGTLVDTRLVLAAYGLEVEDLEARYLAAGQAVELIRKGELDGLFLVAGTPTAAIAGLAETTALQLVPIAGEEASEIEQSWPFFSHTTIQSGTYRGIAATRTLSVGAQWLVSADLPDELVTAITAALWHPASRRLLDTGHPKGKLIELDSALNSLGVPLHPGALAYYEQRGVTFIDEEYDSIEEPSTSELDVAPQPNGEGFGEIE